MLISVRVLMTLAARDFTSSLNRASGQAAGSRGKQCSGQGGGQAPTVLPCPKHPSYPAFLCTFQWQHRPLFLVCTMHLQWRDVMPCPWEQGAQSPLLV